MRLKNELDSLSVFRYKTFPARGVRRMGAAGVTNVVFTMYSVSVSIFLCRQEQDSKKSFQFGTPCMPTFRMPSQTTARFV